MGDKGKFGEIFHNEFIRSLGAWLALGGGGWGVLKFVIQFYQGNEISITFSLIEILIATSIASAVLSIWAFARIIKTKRDNKAFIEAFSDLSMAFEGRLKIIEDKNGK